MRKFLLSITLSAAFSVLAFGAKTNPKGELAAVFSEDFRSFARGSETEPAAEELSAGGKIDVTLTGGHEWQGRGLHEAGGALAVMHFDQTDWFGTESVQGYVRTPYTDVRMDGGSFMLRFKAKTLSEAASRLQIEVYDPYTTNSVDAGKVDITDSWTTFELDLRHPGYGNHLAFLEIASEGEDWLLDDVEIVQDYYELSAPIVHFARDVSYERFTGRWNPVPFADEYLVSVYSIDAGGRRNYLVENQKTPECTLTVNGTQKGTDYYYFVKSVNDRYVSAESEIRQVHVPLDALETPIALEADNVSKDGFTARWEPTFRAMGYIIGLSKQYTASEDMTVTLVEEDFNKIKDGTMDWTSPFYGNLDDYTSLPGWQYNYFTTRTAKGMLVIDNTYKHYGEDCYLSTPALDLSGDGGRFTVVMDVYGDKGNVVSLSCGGTTATHLLEEQGQQQFSVVLDGGSTASVIRIEFDGEPSGYNSYLFIDNIKVEQQVHAGDKVTENVGNYKTSTTDTSYSFTGLNAEFGDTYIYTVTAWSYSLDEDGVWGPDIFSEVSEPREVTIKDSENSVEGISAGLMPTVSVSGRELIIHSDESVTAEVYDVAGGLIGRYELIPGRNVIAPQSSGVLIVKAGQAAWRVMIH